MHPDDRASAQTILTDLQDQLGGTHTLEVHSRHVNGSGRWIEMTLTNLLHEPAVEGLVINYTDINERKLLAEQLWRQAFHDRLTNLASRALFADSVGLALTHGRQHGTSTGVF